ncbi:Flp pilus assembly protein CpaB [Massilia sp.]|uniref:Flp pilus assembly protein CpaB n=1 Tax=Massilia sp. TaxID=1882437 RepID=UPI0028AD6E52|nr:Flp pilus assembly protein CpaB [Massilia sp.]
MKISKNTLLLGGAIVLGIVCYVGAQYYLRSSLSAAQARLAGDYKTRQVIVAATDIPAGGVLSEDNLAARSIPQRYLSSTTLGPDDLDIVAGQKIVVDVKAGDPIDRGALDRSDRAALSTTVANGERAITFPVDEVSSISGMLVPGDVIDLLYTGPGNTENSYRRQPGAEPGPKELLHVRPILQAVQVIATGKTTRKRVVQTQAGGSEEVNMDFTTVTLKVTPAQAQEVLMGQSLGSLTAVLRNPEDTSSLPKMVLDETRFKKVADAPQARGGRFNASYIEMYVGGLGGGAVRSRTQQEAAPPITVRLDGVAPQAAPASAPTPAPGPTALDVRSRLGIAAPAPATKNTATHFPLTRNQ